MWGTTVESFRQQNMNCLWKETRPSIRKQEMWYLATVSRHCALELDSYYACIRMWILICICCKWQIILWWKSTVVHIVNFHRVVKCTKSNHHGKMCSLAISSWVIIFMVYIYTCRVPAKRNSVWIKGSATSLKSRRSSQKSFKILNPNLKNILCSICNF